MVDITRGVVIHESKHYCMNNCN